MTTTPVAPPAREFFSTCPEGIAHDLRKSLVDGVRSYNTGPRHP
jgi:hypothetical protein